MGTASKHMNFVEILLTTVLTIWVKTKQSAVYCDTEAGAGFPKRVSEASVLGKRSNSKAGEYLPQAGRASGACCDDIGGRNGFDGEQEV